jgi:hypothetical protein
MTGITVKLRCLAEINQQFPGIKTKGPFFAVCEMRDGFTISIGDGVCRGDKCQCRQQNFIIRLDTGEYQADVQGSCPVDDGHGPFHPRVFYEHGFEPVHVLARGRDPAGVKAFPDISPFAAGKPGLVENDMFVTRCNDPVKSVKDGLVIKASHIFITAEWLYQDLFLFRISLKFLGMRYDIAVSHLD